MIITEVKRDFKKALRATASRFPDVGQNFQAKFILPQDLLRFKLFKKISGLCPPASQIQPRNEEDLASDRAEAPL